MTTLSPITRQGLTIKLLPGEYWWGGLVHDGVMMPYGASEYRRDLFGNLAGNQGGPLLLSNKGRSIWSEDPYTFAFRRRTLEISSVSGPVELNEGQRNLREA